MLAIRGVYDGKTFSALPGEPLPRVQREVPVAIVFLEEVSPEADRRQRQVEVARRMRAAREDAAAQAGRVCRACGHAWG
jgi:hypothetical protein